MSDEFRIIVNFDDAVGNDVQTTFADITGINSELEHGMRKLLAHFPSLKRPKIYMVAGLEQNVVVTDSTLSLSADKYMGADYPLYKDCFYDYERIGMMRERIVPDYLLGFMTANFPFQGNDAMLLDRMLYAGKLRYILSQLIPNRPKWDYVGYIQYQYEWCEKHEAEIWQLIDQNQYLLKPDAYNTDEFFRSFRCTSPLSDSSPDRVGVWLGYRLVDAYMKNHKQTTWQELINKTEL
ncbi:MAG: hypothetical protein LBN93_08700 [Candidatus Symbiothrix sp.]|nr:hypothetical protein [Candidatus Symbiothrix sp.]